VDAPSPSFSDVVAGPVVLPPPPHAAKATAETAASAAIKRKIENFFTTRPPKN
jgi:hypothetical protein